MSASAPAARRSTSRRPMAIVNVQKEAGRRRQEQHRRRPRALQHRGRADADHGAQEPRRSSAIPTAVDPQTGQLLHPPPAPPVPPPDPKLLAAQARAQTDHAAAAHKAQLEQQKSQSDTIHQQVKIQAEIELAKIKAELDAKWRYRTDLKAATESQKKQHAQERITPARS